MSQSRKRKSNTAIDIIEAEGFSGESGGDGTSQQKHGGGCSKTFGRNILDLVLGFLQIFSKIFVGGGGKKKEKLEDEDETDGRNVVEEKDEGDLGRCSHSHRRHCEEKKIGLTKKISKVLDIVLSATMTTYLILLIYRAIQFELCLAMS